MNGSDWHCSVIGCWPWCPVTVLTWFWIGGCWLSLWLLSGWLWASGWLHLWLAAWRKDRSLPGLDWFVSCKGHRCVMLPFWLVSSWWALLFSRSSGRISFRAVEDWPQVVEPVFRTNSLLLAACLRCWGLTATLLCWRLFLMSLFGANFLLLTARLRCRNMIAAQGSPCCSAVGWLRCYSCPSTIVCYLYLFV